MARLIRRTLRLLEESEVDVVGEDVSGRVVGFFKNSVRAYVLNRSGNAVHVTCYPYQLHNRPWKTTYDQREPRTKKKCLLCKHEFMAIPQIRVCGPCKESIEWKSGSEFWK